MNAPKHSLDGLLARRGSRHLAVVACAMAAFLLSTQVDGTSWIVPGVANTLGANLNRFMSDVTLVNSGSTAAMVTLSLIVPPGVSAPPAQTISLAPGQTLFLPDVLGTWNFSGIGALRVSTEANVAIFARTYVIAQAVQIPEDPRPSYGGSLPVLAEEKFLRAGETGHAAWILSTLDLTTKERANVAVVFPSVDGGTANVTLYDDRGGALGTLRFDSPAAAFIQLPLRSFTSSPLEVPIGRITINVLRGSAHACGGVVGNTTGDLSFVTSEPLPAPPLPPQRLDFVSPGVAQTAGLDSFWRTEARIANPGGIGASVTAQFFGATSTRPQTGYVFLQPGQTVEIRDLVQSLFNVSGPALGAILWRADAPVLILTRTVTSDQHGATVGAVKTAVPLDQFLTSQDGAAELADLRVTFTYRTDLIAVSGIAGATYDLDVHGEEGGLLFTRRETLPALGYSQLSLDPLISPFVLPQRIRVRARVRVVQGSVNVTAAVVSAASNDLVFFEAWPRGTSPSPSGPLVPVGSWGGAFNGMDHVITDARTITLFRFCQTGSFPQPLSVDAAGRFTVMGSYSVQIGPSFSFDAILSGQLEGDRLTLRVQPIPGVDTGVDTNPQTFVFGAPFQPFTGICPVEY